MTNNQTLLSVRSLSWWVRQTRAFWTRGFCRVVLRMHVQGCWEERGRGQPRGGEKSKGWSLASGSACSAHITFTSRSRDRPLTYTTLLGCMMRQGFRLQMLENVALTGFVYKKKKERMKLSWFLYLTHQGCVHAKSLQSCPILCNPMDCSPPGSPVHGISQARILKWVAMPSSRGSS